MLSYGERAVLNRAVRVFAPRFPRDSATRDGGLPRRKRRAREDNSIMRARFVRIKSRTGRRGLISEIVRAAIVQASARCARITPGRNRGAHHALGQLSRNRLAARITSAAVVNPGELHPRRRAGRLSPRAEKTNQALVTPSCAIVSQKSLQHPTKGNPETGLPFAYLGN